MTFHKLHTDIPKPEKFTYPFCYEPHPLCLLAAREVQRYITENKMCGGDSGEGKMFGVLVVEDKNGETGYLAAYSGLLNGKNDWEFFVPPVYNSQCPDGHFKRKEMEITALNREIGLLEGNKDFAEAIQVVERMKAEGERAVNCHKEAMAAAKAARDEKRRNMAAVTHEEETEMVRESQFMKAELKRIKRHYGDMVAAAEKKYGMLRERISCLKKQRKDMSDALQEWLFRQYILLNARGEARNINDIFIEQTGHTPPAGTGDCCAPKLLQHAFSHGLRPVCMAEFWWGAPPNNKLRRQGYFYPSCSGKCKPLLAHMLKGLEVDADPMATGNGAEPEIVYEDRYIIVVNKPAGYLSVPGRSAMPSVQSFVTEHCPDANGPIIVHRLDMATSGLMVMAKDKETHRLLQEQFKARTVKKRYAAVLDGTWHGPEHGTISLPMRPDMLDRPRQTIDYANGKAAVTEYQITGTSENRTYIHLFPHTGRTHQLRVHCAHKDGLGLPIIGDTLYGKKADRLYLHAERLEFTHPVTLNRMAFERIKNDK